MQQSLQFSCLASFLSTFFTYCEFWCLFGFKLGNITLGYSPPGPGHSPLPGVGLEFLFPGAAALAAPVSSSALLTSSSWKKLSSFSWRYSYHLSPWLTEVAHRAGHNEVTEVPVLELRLLFLMSWTWLTKRPVKPTLESMYGQIREVGEQGFWGF